MNQNYFIGVDLGGTKTEVAVLDADHRFLLRERLPTPQHAYTDIIATIATLVGLAKQRYQLPAHHPVGIGMPGCIDPATHKVRGANTQVLNGQAFQNDLQSALGCPVFIENDANCLALSEGVDGASSGSRVAFAAILGTGCGAGITLGTNIWTGRNALGVNGGTTPCHGQHSKNLKRQRVGVVSKVALKPGSVALRWQPTICETHIKP